MQTLFDLLSRTYVKKKWVSQEPFSSVPDYVCLNCDSLRWSHTHFICIPAVHIISFCVSFPSRVDELNKLASLQCMGLHSSGWESAAALTQRPRVRIPLKPRNHFFSGFFAIAQIAIHCDGHILISNSKFVS